jgi:hypothetical protein
VPPLRLVPRFALHASQLDPAAGSPGNQTDSAQLRWVSAAVATAGDVLARLAANATGEGVGLRGGSFRVVNDASTVHVALNEVRWVEDLTVSGKIDKPMARTGVVRAELHLTAADATHGDLTVQWSEGVAGATARVRGTLDGAAVVAQTPAP